MMEMSDEHKALYVELRAGVIKHFHDTRNPGRFSKGFDLEFAKGIAKRQLKYDLEKGELRITLEELLLNQNEACVGIIQRHIDRKIKDLILLSQ